MNVTKITRLITLVGLLGLLLMPMVTLAVDANFGLENIQTGGGGIDLGNQDPRETVSKLIGVVLGFLGIVAVIIILVGGFRWMTAGGNDEKVTAARKIIIAGVIGLAIVLAAWGITTFVIKQLYGATGGGLAT